MEKKDKVFADGFIFKRSENAPEWVIGKISVKVEDAVAFLNKNTKNGWVNLNVNQSQNGKIYIELDTWEKAQGYQSKPKVEDDWSPKAIAVQNAQSYSQKPKSNSDDLPF